MNLQSSVWSQRFSKGIQYPLSHVNSWVAERTPRLHLVMLEKPSPQERDKDETCSKLKKSLCWWCYTPDWTPTTCTLRIGLSQRMEASEIWKPSNRINTSPLGSWVSEQGIVWTVQVPHLPHLARDVVLDVRVHPALEERSRHSVLLPQAILEGVLTVQRVRLNFISNSRSNFFSSTPPGTCQGWSTQQQPRRTGRLCTSWAPSWSSRSRRPISPCYQLLSETETI